MKNANQWTPSKFVLRNGRLLASRDPREVGVGSRLVADRVAGVYEAHLPAHARGRLVDLGCGRVPLYEAYKDLVSENVCVDWGNSLHKSEHLDFECDLCGRLPFQDGEFNTILLSDVLEHVSEPEHLWTEMARILKPGGKLLLNVPFCYGVHEAPHDFYRYTEFALRRFAEMSGFRTIVLQPIGGAPEVLMDILAKHLQSIPLLGRPLASALQAITQALVRAGPGRKISEKTARSHPLGYFMVVERI